MKSIFYSDIKESESTKPFIDEIREYSAANNTQVYLLNRPLGEKKYEYENENKFIVILSPKHKLIFLNILGTKDEFSEYVNDFVEDLGSISDKYGYRPQIGRPRNWEENLTTRIYERAGFVSAEHTFRRNRLTEENEQRKAELLISLLIGSINDIDKIGIEEPSSILEKIRRKIILFDGEQTRFIYQVPAKKRINIQGLSGTGKTELLLHKVREFYISSDTSRILFTCHNRVLAANLRRRIPDFFNFMRVEKQIEWDKRLWVVHGWGSQRDPNSGAYSYICDFYDIEFNRYSTRMTFDKACAAALESIDKIDIADFEFAFDYILIDESQDFPVSFFRLCEKVAREKVYIAGDIFQDIFEGDIKERIVEADFILNRCYRTDPRTLMFAHSLGMGLFESPKINWLEPKEWEACGYHQKKDEETSECVCLFREPVRRFEDLETQAFESTTLSIVNDPLTEIMNILQSIKTEHPTVKPDDVAVIFIDSDKYIYDYAGTLEWSIPDKTGWATNIAYETKEKVNDSVFVSNRNNVKGLEFPFVVCYTNEIVSDPGYRNTLYTMLTRSFIKSYLLVKGSSKLEAFQHGLEVINTRSCISTKTPSPAEINQINRTIIRYNKEKNISYDQFLEDIFSELEVKGNLRNPLRKMVLQGLGENFDKSLVSEFIESNLKFIAK